MKQSSEQFMNEMIKDNTPVADAAGIQDHEKLEKMIDAKLDSFWKKFQSEVASIIPNAADTTTASEGEENVDNSVDNVDNQEGE